VEYATKAGYDSNRMADFFTTLQARRRCRALEGRSAGMVLDPSQPVDREAAVRSQTVQWRSRLPGQAFRVNRDAYLDKVDGLLYGMIRARGSARGTGFTCRAIRCSSHPCTVDIRTRGESGADGSPAESRDHPV